jgi:hypothetical protein
MVRFSDNRPDTPHLERGTADEFPGAKLNEKSLPCQENKRINPVLDTLTWSSARMLAIFGKT